MKSNIARVGGLLMALAPAVALHAQQPLTAPLGLSQLASAVAAYEKPRVDQFAPPPPEDTIIGQRFRVESVFPQLIDEGAPQAGRIGGWQYDPVAQTLLLSPWTQFVPGSEMDSDPSLKDGDKSFIGFSVRTNGHYVGKSVEGNALGATIGVDQSMATTLIVAAFSPTVESDPFPSHDPTTPFEQKVPMSPADARAVTPHLKLFVEGTVAPYAGRQAIACGDTMTPATFERHSEQLIHECVISAQIDEFGIEDGSGKVLADWKAPAAASTAAVPGLPGPIAAAAQARAETASAGGGIGISFLPTPSGVVIMWVAPGSRAAAAGLRPGAVVESVNGVSVVGMSPADAISAMRASTSVIVYRVAGGGDVTVTR